MLCVADNILAQSHPTTTARAVRAIWVLCRIRTTRPGARLSLCAASRTTTTIALGASIMGATRDQEETTATAMWAVSRVSAPLPHSSRPSRVGRMTSGARSRACPPSPWMCTSYNCIGGKRRGAMCTCDPLGLIQERALPRHGCARHIILCGGTEKTRGDMCTSV